MSNVRKVEFMAKSFAMINFDDENDVIMRYLSSPGPLLDDYINIADLWVVECIPSY